MDMQRNRARQAALQRAGRGRTECGHSIIDRARLRSCPVSYYGVAPLCMILRQASFLQIVVSLARLQTHLRPLLLRQRTLSIDTREVDIP